MVPFYTFYSMFGFQRVGDLIWQAADSRTRGFLLGATAGRTTLMGEGLQHQDGHSLVLASTVPAVQAYDPAFAYEVAAIVQAGLQRMYGQTGGESGLDPDVFYYLTLYNENFPMPAATRRPRPGRRHHARPVPVRSRAGRRPSRRRCCSAARRTARPTRRPPHCATATTSVSSCGRPRRTRRCARRRSPSSAGTACTRRNPRARRWSPELLAESAGPDRRRHRLHEDRARADRPLAARPHLHAARHRRHGPLGHTRGAAPVLRDRRGPRRRRRAVGAWPHEARSTPTSSTRRSASTTSTPKPSTPTSSESARRADEGAAG